MVKFCPACGSKLGNEFKYCPSCGYNLQNIGTPQVSSEKINIIECKNCGTENPYDAGVCEGCGIKLNGESRTVTKISSTINVQQKKSFKDQKSKKKEQPQQPVNTFKEIDSKKIYGILGAVLIVGFIILQAAGVFDKPVSSVSNTNLNQSQNSGVDLSSLQRINELEEILKANPNDNKSLLELAHLRNDSRMFDKAIENYQLYLTHVPEDADARIDMGVCYYNLGRYDEAIAAMTKALEYNPNHQIGHLNLGIVNLSAGNVAKSKEWLLKAVSLGPETDAGKRAQELLTSH
jgi:ribosomal protein L40E